MSQNPTETQPIGAAETPGHEAEEQKGGSPASEEATERFVPSGAPPPETQGRRKVRRFGKDQDAPADQREPGPANGANPPGGPAHYPENVVENEVENEVESVVETEGPHGPHGPQGRPVQTRSGVRRGPLDESEIAAAQYLDRYPDPIAPEGVGNGAPNNGVGGDFSGDGTAPDPRQSDTQPIDSGWPPRRTRIILVALAVLVLVTGLLGVRAFWGGGASEPAPNFEQAQQGAQQGSAAGDGALVSRTPGGAQLSPDAIPVEDTGIVFDPLPQQKDGEVTLRARDTNSGESYAWKGKIEAGDQGGASGQDAQADSAEAEAVGDFDTLLLEGMTYADFRGGFGLPKGELRNGTFAWAVPGGLVVRAEYDQATEPEDASADGPGQESDGSFKVLEEKTGEIMLSGTYSDTRRPGSNAVIRTYMERDPGSETWEMYRRKYQAPPETPIPMLVGWEEPQIENGK